MRNKIKGIELLELNESYKKVLNWFFSFPNKATSLNELSDTLKISKSTSNRILKKLEKEGLIKIEVIGRNWRISLNKNNEKLKGMKISYNINLIYESGIIEEIKELFPNFISIILFGSYRKGDDIEESDIDIAVETLGKKDIEITEFSITNLDYRKNVKLNILVFSRSHVNKNLFSNIVNGIVLEGFLEVD